MKPQGNYIENPFTNFKIKSLTLQYFASQALEKLLNFIP
jgi:hypothetical protein